MGVFKEIAVAMAENNQVNPACLENRQKDDWRSIDWKNVEEKVREIQNRIAKAAKLKRWRLVKRLQRLLTHSYFAKLLAVKRVTENHGKNTTGIDGVRWPTPESKLAAARSLEKKGYKAKALKRVFIPKKNGKKRPLGIPTMKDRAMQALYLLALEPVSETLSLIHI